MKTKSLLATLPDGSVVPTAHAFLFVIHRGPDGWSLYPHLTLAAALRAQASFRECTVGYWTGVVEAEAR